MPGRKIVFTKKNSVSKRYGDLYILEPAGALVQITSGSTAPAPYDSAGGDFSASGEQLVFDSSRDCNPNSEIYIVALDDLASVTRLTTSGMSEDAAWDRTNNLIVFSSERNGNYGPYTMEANGANQRELFPGHPRELQFCKWNVSGEKIVFLDYFSGLDQRVGWAELSSLNIHHLTGQHRDDAPAFSPPLPAGNTEKVVFSREQVIGGMREGKSDLYSVNLDGSELTKLTNATIGTMINQPAWSPDGLYILYSKKIGAAPFQLYELELDSGIETQITNDAGFDHFDAAYAP